jgi:ankyrin repeat protein
VTPTYGPRHRGVRGQETNLNQSIDFSASDGLETPALVRAAQAGSRVEVERLIDNGNDIEAFHGPTRRTALAVAAHCGNSEVVAALIQFNANLSPRDHTLATPLHLAASRGHIGALEVLLNEGVPLEETDNKKATALWIAVYRGHLEAAELLIQRGANVNTRAEGQLTSLHVAAQGGDAEMVELLLRHSVHVESRDSQFMAGLHYACAKGHQAVVDVLLEKGASIEAMGADGRSPLICAAAEGHRHVVELLLRRKASPRSKDERENNALHWAAYYGHVDVADLLLHKKLPINDRNADGLTPLHLAVIGSQFSAVEFLLRMNAMLEPQCRQGRMPMHYACGSDNSDIVRLLLGAGAQAEIPIASDLRKPLHIAASTGNVEIVQLLCEKGVTIDSRDSAGDRPLCVAAYYGHTEVVEKLLDFKAPLRLPFGDRSYEDSPLCVAVKEGHLGVVSVLLRRGALVRQKDELGWQPIRYAAHFGHPDVLELLLTQASTISDDTTGMSASDYSGDYVGFAAGSNISEERRRRVRQLLSKAGDPVNAYMPERVLPLTTPGFSDKSESQAAELDTGLPGRNQAMLSYSQEMGATMASGRLYYGSPAFVPRPSDPEPPRHRAFLPKAFGDSKTDPFVSGPSSGATVSDMPVTCPHPAVNKPPLQSDSVYNHPWRPSIPPQMSSMPQLSPEEAAMLIEDRRNEIAQLQLFLPPVDEGTVRNDRENYAPAPLVYEMPS